MKTRNHNRISASAMRPPYLKGFLPAQQQSGALHFDGF
jgi:hypothetical protein